MKELKDAQSLSPKQYQGKIRYKEKVDRISAAKAKNCYNKVTTKE